MDWEAREKERLKTIADEREKFITISEVESLRLSNADRYQRMRYQRELEAAEWLTNLKRSIPLSPVNEVKRKYSKPGKLIYNHD